MEITETTEIKKSAKLFFKKHKFVLCPAFPKEKVVFNSKALSHLFYKGSGKVFARPAKEAAIRTNLLPSAYKVLKLMALAQEESEFIDKKGRVCRYFAFEAVVDSHRIKVVVRQLGNGNKQFWSVIPAWRRIRGKIVKNACLQLKF